MTGVGIELSQPQAGQLKKSINGGFMYVQKWSKNGPKMLQNWSKNGPAYWVTLLCHCVPEILTLQNRQMLSFPNRYNAMGSKMDGLAAREHFLSKNAFKTAILSATFSDYLTSERSSNHNFKDLDDFHMCFGKFET